MENRVVLFEYKGYELVLVGGKYISMIDEEVLHFNNAGLWKKFIDEKLCQDKKDR